MRAKQNSNFAPAWVWGTAPARSISHERVTVNVFFMARHSKDLAVKIRTHAVHRVADIRIVGMCVAMGLTSQWPPVMDCREFKAYELHATSHAMHDQAAT